MKKLLTSFTFITLFALSSCGRADNKTSNTPSINLNVDEQSIVQVYETTGNRSKLLTRASDLTIDSYEFSGNTEVYVENEVLSTYDGFGAALTHSSAYLLNELSKEARSELLTSLFAKEEANFSFLRIPLGTSDFTLDEEPFYTFNDSNSKDYTLTNFTIEKDLRFFIPMLKEIIAINPDIKIMGAPWSAPAWMKSSNSLIGGSLIGYENETLENPTIEEIAYANYLFKTLEAYKEEGITIHYISILNEPMIANVNYPSMRMESGQYFRVVKELAKKLEGSTFDYVRISAFDHNIDQEDDITFELYVDPLVEDPLTNKYVDSFAIHCYSGNWPNVYQGYLHNMKERYPSKKIYITEVTEVQTSVDFAQNLGWSMANVTVGPVAYGLSSAMYWNLLLDQDGKPVKGNAAKLYGIANVNRDKITYSSAYYSLLHTSKFVDVGASILSVYSTNESRIISSAFSNQNGDTVIVLSNIDDRITDTVDVVFNEENKVTVNIEPQSITTLIVTKGPQNLYETIDVTHIDIYQIDRNTHTFKVETKENHPQLDIYIEEKAADYLLSNKVNYEKVDNTYEFIANIGPGEKYLNIKASKKEFSLLIAIPDMRPKINVTKDDAEGYYIEADFGLNPNTSWSSFSDPFGKHVYKSKLDIFDNTAIKVNELPNGENDNIYITTEQYTDTNGSKEIENYYFLLEGKGGLITYHSSAVNFRDAVIEKGSEMISLIIEDGIPYFQYEATYLKEDFTAASLLFKDIEGEEHYSLSPDGQTFLLKFDLTNLEKRNVWYDILLVRGSGSSYDIYINDVALLNESIEVDGKIYEFKEWEGVLKINHR